MMAFLWLLRDVIPHYSASPFAAPPVVNLQGPAFYALSLPPQPAFYRNTEAISRNSEKKHGDHMTRYLPGYSSGGVGRRFRRKTRRQDGWELAAAHRWLTDESLNVTVKPAPLLGKINREKKNKNHQDNLYPHVVGNPHVYGLFPLHCVNPLLMLGRGGVALHDASRVSAAHFWEKRSQLKSCRNAD